MVEPHDGVFYFADVHDLHFILIRNHILPVKVFEFYLLVQGLLGLTMSSVYKCFMSSLQHLGKSTIQ